MSKYPIEIIEEDFVRNRLGFRELSIKYKISERLCVYHSHKKNWVAKREAYFQKGVAKREKAKSFDLISKLDNLIEKKAHLENLTTDDAINQTNPRARAYILNKSKADLTELIKTRELLLGNATDRTEFLDAEKSERAIRILQMSKDLTDQSVRFLEISEK